MSDVNERIAVFLEQEQAKLERLRSLVGPLFSQESFEAAVKKYSEACNVQIRRMIDEDLSHSRRNTEALPSISSEQILSSASGHFPTASWNVSSPIIPHAVMKPSDLENNYMHKVKCPYMGCKRLCGNPGSYFRHKQTHEENGDMIDPDKIDYVAKHKIERATKSESEEEGSKYQFHFDPTAHELKSAREGDVAAVHGGSPGEQHSASSGFAAGVHATVKSSAGKKRKALEERPQRNDGDSMSDVSVDPVVPTRGYVGGASKPQRRFAEKRSQYSVLFKMQAIQKYDEYVANGTTVELQSTVARYFGINQSSICRWVRQRKEIAAAFQTAEQDRMRVTMTFKRRNAELTGQYEDYEDYAEEEAKAAKELATAVGLHASGSSSSSGGGGGGGGGKGAIAYEPTNLLPAYSAASSQPSYGYYGSAPVGSSSSSYSAAAYPTDPYSGYMGQAMMQQQQYPPLPQQHQHGQAASYGAPYGYYPTTSQMEMTASMDGAGFSSTFASGVSSALSLNDSSVLGVPNTPFSGPGGVVLPSLPQRSPQPQTPP